MIFFIIFYTKALPQAARYNEQLNNSLELTERNGRIVGGRDALITEFPFIVALLRFNAHICGGTILNANTILTAAHCTE